MLKFKPFIIILSLLALGFVGAWLAVGPKVMAQVSYMAYHEATYSYNIEIDELYDSESKSISDIGLIVAINPNRSASNQSEFSEAYLQTSRERARQWKTTRRADELIDVMIVFTRPLMLDEVNAILSSAKAHVFESGVVGYANAVPFATYTKEEGPTLTRPLQDYAASYKGFEAEALEDKQSETDVQATDVQGFLAVRVWVQAEALQLLLENKAIQIVDTTPQVVRDQLAANRHWKALPVNTVAIEMPVWAYQW